MLFYVTLKHETDVPCPLQEPPQPRRSAPAWADNGDVEETLPDKEDVNEQEALNMMPGGPANMQHAVPPADHQESVQGAAAGVETPKPREADQRIPGLVSMQDAVPPPDHQESVQGAAAGVEKPKPRQADQRIPGLVSMQDAVPPADHQESGQGAAAAAETPEPRQADQRISADVSMQQAVPPAHHAHQESVLGKAPKADETTAPALTDAQKRSGAVMQALQRPNSFQLQARMF